MINIWDLIKNNIELILALFAALMLIISNNESKKARRMQYLPYLRLSSKNKSMEFSEKNKGQDTKYPDIELLTSDVIDIVNSNPTSINIHNDGLGMAKDISISVDVTHLIHELKKLEIKGSKLFYLKPYFDEYFIRSFDFDIELYFRQYLSSISRLKIKIVNKINVFIHKKFDSQKNIAIKIPQSKYVYDFRQYDILKADEEINLKIQPIFDFFALITMFEGSKDRYNLKVPIKIVYYDLENRRRCNLLQLSYNVNHIIFGTKMTNNSLNSVVNGELSIEDFMKVYNHTTSYSISFEHLGSLRRKVNSIKLAKLKFFG